MRPDIAWTARLYLHELKQQWQSSGRSGASCSLQSAAHARRRADLRKEHSGHVIVDLSSIISFIPCARPGS